LIDDQLPYISLHFDEKGILYSVINPFYEQTIVGHVIGFLDYVMKCFVNGGFFNEEFIFSYTNDQNTDSSFLNSNIIPIRNYLRDNMLTNLRYKSLAELGSTSFDEKGNQRYFSPFRIIGTMMSEIVFEDSILFPKASLTVQHDIDPLPKFQVDIDRDMSKGKENNEYQTLKKAHHIMSILIEKVIPEFPVFREYFALLKIITFAIHYVIGLSGTRMLPKLKNPFRETYMKPFPTHFPPLPVQKVFTVKSSITLGLFFNKLQQAGQERQIILEIQRMIKRETMRIDPVVLSQMENTLRSMHFQALQQQIPDNQIAHVSDEELGVRKLLENMHLVIDTVVELPFKRLEGFPQEVIKCIEIFLRIELSHRDRSEYQFPSRLKNKFIQQMRHCRAILSKGVTFLRNRVRTLADGSLSAIDQQVQSVLANITQKEQEKINRYINSFEKNIIEQCRRKRRSFASEPVQEYVNKTKQGIVVSIHEEMATRRTNLLSEARNRKSEVLRNKKKTRLQFKRYTIHWLNNWTKSMCCSVHRYQIKWCVEILNWTSQFAFLQHVSPPMASSRMFEADVSFK
jgi:hypothetical protein